MGRLLVIHVSFKDLPVNLVNCSDQSIGSEISLERQKAKSNPWPRYRKKASDHLIYLQMDSLAQNRQTGKPPLAMACHPLAPCGHVPQRCKTGKVKKKKQDCHPFCGSSSTTHPSLSVQLGLQTPQGLPTPHSPKSAEEQSPNL